MNTIKIENGAELVKIVLSFKTYNDVRNERVEMSSFRGLWRFSNWVIYEHRVVSKMTPTGEGRAPAILIDFSFIYLF